MISIATLWKDIEAFCTRFSLHQSKLFGRPVDSAWPGASGDAGVRVHLVRILRALGDDVVVMRRLTGDGQLKLPLTTRKLLDAPAGCARVDDAMIANGKFDPSTLVVGAAWPAVLQGLGVAGALAQSTAPMANLNEKHLKLLCIVARTDFRGVLKAVVDDGFKDDKKHTSYLIKHLVTLGLIRKVDVLRPGLASATAILWLAAFAPPRNHPPDLPDGYVALESEAAQKSRIMSIIADMPGAIIVNRDLLAACTLRKDRLVVIRGELVQSGHVQLINAVDHSRERVRDPANGKEARGLYCWRMLKPFEYRPTSGFHTDTALTHFSTRRIDDADAATTAAAAGAAAAAADDSDDDAEDEDGSDAGSEGDGDSLPMRPLCLEMSLNDQILECIRDSGARGLSAREVCTCLGLNSPADMKKMVPTLAHLSRDYGFASEAVFVGKVRYVRFKWVENQIELAMDTAASRFNASVEARAKRIYELVAERKAISKSALLNELRELEDNPVLDRPTIERALAHQARAPAPGQRPIRSEAVRHGKRTITMFITPDAANNDPAVMAVRKSLEDSKMVQHAEDFAEAWGPLMDYGEIARLDDASNRRRWHRELSNGPVPAPRSGSAVGSSVDMGAMLRARLLHMAMCSLIGEAPAAAGAAAAAAECAVVRRERVFERLTLDQLLRFFVRSAPQLPAVLTDPDLLRKRLSELEAADRETVESVLGINTSMVGWRHAMRTLTRIGLVEEVPNKNDDEVHVRRWMMADLSRRSVNDAGKAPRRIAFDHSVALKNEMELRRFWQRFEVAVRLCDTKSHDVSGTVVVECAKPSMWHDADRAKLNSVLEQYVALAPKADSIIDAINMASDGDVNIGAIAARAKEAKVSTDAVLAFADAYWRIEIDKRSEKRVRERVAPVASKRAAPSSAARSSSASSAKRNVRVLDRRYLHMPLRVQRRALRRAVMLAKGELDDLEHADDDTELSDSDDADSDGLDSSDSDTDSDLDSDDSERERRHRRVDSGDVAAPRKRARRTVKVAGAASAAKAERAVLVDRGVATQLRPAQLLALACLLAWRFVMRQRKNSHAWSKAPTLTPSSNVPQHLIESDFGGPDEWHEVCEAMRWTRVQCRSFFRSAMRSELFPAQLYTQIRRITAQQNMRLPNGFVWLHSFFSPLVPDMPLPASVAQLRERYAVYEVAPGASSFALVDPYALPTSSFEPPNAAVLYVADALLLYLAGVDDDHVLPIFNSVPATLRTAALLHLHEQHFTARNAARKKPSDWLEERSIDGERLSSAVRARLERHLADHYNVPIDDQRRFGKTTEPLLPLAVHDARVLQQRIAAAPGGVVFGPQEPAGAVLAMLEMVLRGDVAPSHEFVPAAASSGARPNVHSLRVTLSERKHADVARARFTLPILAAARNEVLVEPARVFASLRESPAAQRAIAAATAAPRGLTATELEAAFFGPSVGEWRALLTDNDAFVTLGECHYLHGTLAAALFTGDNAPLERVLDVASAPPTLRYRRRDDARPTGLLLAAPLPIDSCGAKIARRSVLGHYERSPGVRAGTLLERIADASSLVSRVAVADQLHWLAANHLLVARRYDEQVWPSGNTCARIVLRRSAHSRHYPPSAALHLTPVLPQLPPNVVIKIQQDQPPPSQ